METLFLFILKIWILIGVVLGFCYTAYVLFSDKFSW